MDTESIVECLHAIPDGKTLLSKLNKDTPFDWYIIRSSIDKSCVHLYCVSDKYKSSEALDVVNHEPHIKITVLSKATPTIKAPKLEEILAAS